jgi:hypothetical protein
VRPSRKLEGSRSEELEHPSHRKIEPEEVAQQQQPEHPILLIEPGEVEPRE